MIDGQQPADYMIDSNIGLRDDKTYKISIRIRKRITLMITLWNYRKNSVTYLLVIIIIIIYILPVNKS
jgi:hypothetical protein